MTLVFTPLISVDFSIKQDGGSKVRHTRTPRHNYDMFAAVDDGGIEGAQSLLEAVRIGVQSLILGEDWELYLVGKKQVCKVCKVRCKICDYLRRDN